MSVASEVSPATGGTAAHGTCKSAWWWRFATTSGATMRRAHCRLVRPATCGRAGTGIQAASLRHRSRPPRQIASTRADSVPTWACIGSSLSNKRPNRYTVEGTATSRSLSPSGFQRPPSGAAAPHRGPNGRRPPSPHGLLRSGGGPSGSPGDPPRSRGIVRLVRDAARTPPFRRRLQMPLCMQRGTSPPRPRRRRISGRTSRPVCRTSSPARATS